MYYVIFWDKSCSIIHNSWLDEKSKTFRWPRTKNPVIQIMKAEIPKDNWFTYVYTRIFGPYETYDEARQFELDTLNLSTNDDDGFAAIKEKRNPEITQNSKRHREKPS
ncbi:hypothetical protein PV325_011041, partial [Microctonus aethiopoides]